MQSPSSGRDTFTISIRASEGREKGKRRVLKHDIAPFFLSFVRPIEVSPHDSSLPQSVLPLTSDRTDERTKIACKEERKRIGRKKRPIPTQPFLSFWSHPSIRKGTLTYREHVPQTSKSFPRSSSACNERTIERKEERKNPHLVCLVPSPIGPIKRSCALASSSRMENKLIFFASLHGYPFITWSRRRRQSRGVCWSSFLLPSRNNAI